MTDTQAAAAEREIRFQWTQRLLRRAWQRHLLGRAIGLKVFTVITTLGGLGCLFQPQISSMRWCGLVPMAIAVGFHVGMRALGARSARVQTAKFGEYEIVCRFTDEGMHVTSPHVNSTTTWAQINRLRRFRDVWLLYVNPITFHILAAPALSADLREFIIRKVWEARAKK
jgi:hypothetical protein